MLTASEEDQLRSFITKSIDFSKRKIQNAAPGIDDHDYVILKQLTDSNLFLQAGSGATKRTVQDKLRERVSVKDFRGTKGDNIHDDTLGFQEGIDYLRSVGGGTLWIPRGVYKLTSPISVYSNIELHGESYALSKDPLPATVLNAYHDGNILVQGENPLFAFKFSLLAFFGTGNSGSRGVWFDTTASGCTFRDSFFHNFGDEAIYIFYGADGEFQNLFIQGSLLVRTGRTDYIGTIDIGVADAQWSHIGATASVEGTGNVGNGLICGVHNRGYNSRMIGVVGHFSQTGMVIDGARVTILECRTDNNQGNGFINRGVKNLFGFNFSLIDSRHGDGAFSGFLTDGYLNRYAYNVVTTNDFDPVQCLHGFEDISSNSGGIDSTANIYTFNIADLIRGNKYEFSGATVKSWADFNGVNFEVYKGLKFERLTSKGDSPTLTAGFASGTGAVVSLVYGDDVCGLISITTGSGCPTGPARVVLVSFATHHSTTPKYIGINEANAAAKSYGQFWSNGDTLAVTGDTFEIANIAALTDFTEYRIYYHVIQ